MAEWTQINKSLRRLGIATDAAENHGILCGLLCAHGSVEQRSWLALMRDEQLPEAGSVEDDLSGAGPELETEFAAGEWSEMEQLYRETVRQLHDEGFLFYPLLPGEDHPLNQRAEAMTDWCKGFVYGLAAGGLDDFSVLPEEVREITQDIIEISRASTETDDGDSDESAYAELIEYLRAGVMLVYETLEAERDSRTGDKVIH